MRLPLATLFAACSLSAQTGSIQGSVTTGSGNAPVKGAVVSALATGLPPAQGTAQSASNGTFQIDGLGARTYTLCVQIPGDSSLNPCAWGGKPTTVTLSAGQKSTGNVVKINSGSTLQVRVQDPNKLTGQKAKDGRTHQVVLGVWGTDGLFYPAHLTNQDAAGLDFKLAIPFDTKLGLHISSPTLKLADSAGAALPANPAPQAFQHTTGDPNPKSFTFTITGALP